MPGRASWRGAAPPGAAGAAGRWGAAGRRLPAFRAAGAQAAFSSETERRLPVFAATMVKFGLQADPAGAALRRASTGISISWMPGPGDAHLEAAAAPRTSTRGDAAAPSSSSRSLAGVHRRDAQHQPERARAAHPVQRGWRPGRSASGAPAPGGRRRARAAATAARRPKRGRRRTRTAPPPRRPGTRARSTGSPSPSSAQRSLALVEADRQPVRARRQRRRELRLVQLGVVVDRRPLPPASAGTGGRRCARPCPSSSSRWTKTIGWPENPSSAAGRLPGRGGASAPRETRGGRCRGSRRPGRPGGASSSPQPRTQSASARRGRTREIFLMDAKTLARRERSVIVVDQRIRTVGGRAVRPLPDRHLGERSGGQPLGQRVEEPGGDPLGRRAQPVERRAPC